MTGALAFGLVGTNSPSQAATLSNISGQTASDVKLVSTSNGTIYAAWSANGKIQSRSTTDGVTWSSTLDISTAVTSPIVVKNLNLAVTKNDKVIAVWSEQNSEYNNGSSGTTSSTIKSSEITNATISTKTIASGLNATSPAISASTTENDKLVVAWSEKASTTYFIKSAVTTDAGATWSSSGTPLTGTTISSDSTYPLWNPEVTHVCDSAGTPTCKFAVVWQKTTAGQNLLVNGSLVQIATSDAAATVWSSPIDVSQANSDPTAGGTKTYAAYPKISTPRSGSLLITWQHGQELSGGQAWSLYSRSSNDLGATWSSIADVDVSALGGSPGVNNLQMAAVDYTSGKSAVIYTYNNNSEVVTKASVGTTDANGVTTWGTAFNLSASAYLSRAKNPQILASNGKLVSTWADGFFTVGIYSSVSIDDGATWSKAQLISDVYDSKSSDKSQSVFAQGSSLLVTAWERDGYIRSTSGLQEVPAVLAAPSAESLSNTSARVTITPATSGGPVSSYTVTADPGGRTCTITPPDTSCVVTGMTSGGSFTFSVIASNSYGSSASSPSSSSITLGSSGGSSGGTPTSGGTSGGTTSFSGASVGPVTALNAIVPASQPVQGSSTTTVNGSTLSTVTTSNLVDKTVTTTSKGFYGGALTYSALEGKNLQPLTINKSISATPGSLINISGRNFKSNSPVQVFLINSSGSAVYVGSIKTNRLGRISGKLQVPTALPVGKYTLQLNGYTRIKNYVKSSNLGMEVSGTSLGTIYFGSNSALATDATIASVKSIAKSLAPNANVTLYGYTAGNTAAKYRKANLDLANNRAKTIQKLFEAEGLKATIVLVPQGAVKGGYNKPASRRVDIRLQVN